MYTIPKLTRRRLDMTLLAIALFVIVFWLLSGCVSASRDPLGTPAHTARERPQPPDFEPRAVVVCRHITGTVKIADVLGGGEGLRCIEGGEEMLQGCMKWKRGDASYESPGCEDAP